MVQRLRHPLIVFTLLGAVIFAVDWILIPEPVSVIHMSDSQRAALRSAARLAQGMHPESSSGRRAAEHDRRGCAGGDTFLAVRRGQGGDQGP